ncbi:MAG: hypothetical protein HFE93_05070 [Acutalibacter muris]|jgi:hypothetical protein|nr:hypothetical protein [Acutalibacter muris]
MELRPCSDCTRKWGVLEEQTNRFEIREAHFCGTCGRPISGYEPPDLAQANVNEPLTLEELKGMVEEPVWIEAPDMPNRHGWAINYGLDPDVMHIQYAEISLDMYGKTWLAYRRKPKETQT